MILCTVGLAFFQDGQNFIDVRVAQLFRRWGSKQTRQLSVSMAALAFLYRGLARFALGETILVEGCTYALQSWFLRHVPSKASSFRFSSKQPKTCHSVSSLDRETASGGDCLGLLRQKRDRSLDTLMLAASVTDCLAPSSVLIISQKDVSDSFRSAGSCQHPLPDRQHARIQPAVGSVVWGIPCHQIYLGLLCFSICISWDQMYLLNIKSGGKLSAHPLFVFEYYYQ